MATRDRSSTPRGAATGASLVDWRQPERNAHVLDWRERAHAFGLLPVEPSGPVEHVIEPPERLGARAPACGTGRGVPGADSQPSVHRAPIYSVIESIIEKSGTPYFSFKDIDENKPSGSIKIRIETIAYFLKRYAEDLQAQPVSEADIDRRVEAYEPAPREQMLAAIGSGSGASLPEEYSAGVAGADPAVERLGRLWKQVSGRRALTVEAPLFAREVEHARTQFETIFDTLLAQGEPYAKAGGDVISRAVHGTPRTPLRADAAR